MLEVGGLAMIDSLTSEKHPSVKWSLCGIPVCFNVFCALLGTSAPTVRKYVRGELDMRKTTADMRAAPRAQPQSRHCDWWFYELYQSAAEPLPEESVDAEALLASMEGVGDPWLQPDLATNCSQDCAIADRPTVESMVRLTLAASASVIGLPKRFLPHGKVHDLYWVFLAAWDLVHQPTRVQVSRSVINPCPRCRLPRRGQPSGDGGRKCGRTTSVSARPPSIHSAKRALSCNKSCTHARIRWIGGSWRPGLCGNTITISTWTGVFIGRCVWRLNEIGTSCAS